MTCSFTPSIQVGKSLMKLSSLPQEKLFSECGNRTQMIITIFVSFLVFDEKFVMLNQITLSNKPEVWTSQSVFFNKDSMESVLEMTVCFSRQPKLPWIGDSVVAKRISKHRYGSDTKEPDAVGEHDVDLPQVEFFVHHMMDMHEFHMKYS